MCTHFKYIIFNIILVSVVETVEFVYFENIGVVEICSLEFFATFTVFPNWPEVVGVIVDDVNVVDVVNDVDVVDDVCVWALKTQYKIKVYFHIDSEL